MDLNPLHPLARFTHTLSPVYPVERIAAQAWREQQQQQQVDHIAKRLAPDHLVFRPTPSASPLGPSD